MVRDFYDLFRSDKPIIGMIHLAGGSPTKKVDNALEELKIYEEEGVEGAIIEDYHGYPNDVENALKEASSAGFNLDLGVNVLRNPYSAFELADKYGAKFIQFDSVQEHEVDWELYNNLRNEYSDISVLGGVGFKGTTSTGNALEKDLNDARKVCEAVVTTGKGTGMETPIKKLGEYKRHLGEFPLVVGAGINDTNVYDQLLVADGAIVGSYFKVGGEDTTMPVDRQRVRNLTSKVLNLRNNLENDWE